MTWAVIPTAHAIEQATEIEAWWRKNRRGAPDVYFLTDTLKQEVTIVALWGAQRGSDPDLGDQS